MKDKTIGMLLTELPPDTKGVIFILYVKKDGYNYLRSYEFSREGCNTWRFICRSEASNFGTKTYIVKKDLWDTRIRDISPISEYSIDKCIRIHYNHKDELPVVEAISLEV